MDIVLSFIDTAVTKALRDIQRDPERSVRNLVDLGQSFSKGRFQKRFLGSAQSMLQNQSSAYYAAARHAVTHVDHATLKTFGINTGYNSCVKGARRIRSLEAEHGINIPWMISLEYAPGEGNVSLEAYDGMIHAAKALGVYSYCIFAGVRALRDLEALLSAHGDCAFTLFLTPGRYAELDVSRLAAHKNLMLALCAQAPDFLETAARLEEARCLYAAYALYDDASIPELLSAAWTEHVASSHCAFLLYLMREGCSAQGQRRVTEYVTGLRDSQRYPLIPMDFYSDMLAIDQVISDQACYMGVRRDGQIYSAQPFRAVSLRIQDMPLLDILKQAMPRTL